MSHDSLTVQPCSLQVLNSSVVRMSNCCLGGQGFDSSWGLGNFIFPQVKFDLFTPLRVLTFTKSQFHSIPYSIPLLSVKAFTFVVLIEDTVNKQTNITNGTETCLKEFELAGGTCQIYIVWWGAELGTLENIAS